MKDKLRDFFRGRYGNDNLNRFLLVLALIFMVIRMFVDSDILYFLTIAIIVYSYFRVFSKNLSKRSQENMAYLTIRNKVTKFFTWNFLKVFGKGGYKYLECSSCKSELKVPKQKGKIKVKCPKCKNEMMIRT